MDGKPARSVSLTDFEKDAIRHLCLLTMKPIIYVTNVAESDLADPGNNSHVKEVMDLASELQSGIVTISAQVRQCHATETINRTCENTYFEESDWMGLFHLKVLVNFHPSG